MAYAHILTYSHGSTVYARIVQQGTGLVWDDNAKALASNPDFDKSAITVTELAGDGDFGLTMPSGIPPGKYLLSYRVQAGGSPANTDTVLAGGLRFRTDGHGTYTGVIA